MEISQDIAIPPIRQDLKIYPNSDDIDGSPTWVIYDPLSDNYFKIGWFEFECLQRFSQVKTSGQLVRLVNKETSLTIEQEDVMELLNFLVHCGLIRANAPHVRDILEEGRSHRKPNFFQKHFLRYIFVNVPLFKPQRFLELTFPCISFMFTRAFLLCVLGLLSVGVFLTVLRWDDFVNSFMAYFGLGNAIAVLCSLILIKAFHELGHAYMAHKYKVPVSTMGIIFIVLYPLLYTETTNAWRIADRSKRIRIAAGGLLAELLLASVALIVWHLSAPGLLQNMAYFVAFLSFALSIFINANPLMKFDGYYLLSDILGVDNLHSRSMAFFKWRMRKIVVGLREDPPEALPARWSRFLVGFGFAQAIYKCFLYSGIALAIYFVVFRPLGFVLAAVFLMVVLGAPIFKEICYWFKERGRIMKNLMPKVLLVLLAVLVVASFLPLSKVIKVPGVLHFEDYKAFYAPSVARIDEIHVENMQHVSKGDVLVSLSSDDLEQEIELTRLNLQLHQKVKARQQASKELSLQNIEIDQKIREEETKLAGLLLEREALQVEAPFDGVVRDVLPSSQEGRWVNPELLLVRVVDEGDLQVTAYVDSLEIDRVEPSAAGVFKSDTKLLGSYDLELFDVSAADTRDVAYQELSSVYGGGIAADRDEASGVVSKRPLYVLKFKVQGEFSDPEFTQKGIVNLQVQSRSFSGRIVEKLASLFLRETGI